MAEGEVLNEGHAAAKALCPYFQRVIHGGRAIICLDDVLHGRPDTFSFLKMSFRSGTERENWSYNYCEADCFSACPIYQALESIAEVSL